MKLSIYRTTLTPRSTIGKLFADGAFLCYTLELPVRDGLPGSAIPAGTYPVWLASSPKFQALAQQDPWFQKYCDAMPHIVGILNRTMIMLHPGNTPDNTDGCVLVGETQGINVIGTSRPAFAKLYQLIQAAMQTPEKCSISVFDEPAQPPLGVDESTQV